jgi:DNA-binding transcriptional MerR regulator
LLPPVARDVGGVRIYEDKDISRLRFIRRAQRMNFTLDEIGHLLQMREDPQHVRNDVRELTQRKLLEIEHNLEDLTVLRNELQLLVNLCRAAEDGCPILEKIEER